MVTCKECKSTNVRVASGNFASRKLEGEPSELHKDTIRLYFCRNCENQWKAIVDEVENEYFEYKELRNKTQIRVQDLNKYADIESIPYINHKDITKRKELAKKIVKEYKHILDIKPFEWLNLEQDIKEI